MHTDPRKPLLPLYDAMPGGKGYVNKTKVVLRRRYAISLAAINKFNDYQAEFYATFAYGELGTQRSSMKNAGPCNAASFEAFKQLRSFAKSLVTKWVRNEWCSPRSLRRCLFFAEVEIPQGPEDDSDNEAGEPPPPPPKLSPSDWMAKMRGGQAREEEEEAAKPTGGRPESGASLQGGLRSREVEMLSTSHARGEKSSKQDRRAVRLTVVQAKANVKKGHVAKQQPREKLGLPHTSPEVRPQPPLAA